MTKNPPEISRALETVVEGDRRRASSTAAALRLGGTLFFFVLALALWPPASQSDWGLFAALLGSYTALALLTFALRHHPVLVRLAWLPPAIDVLVLYLLQNRALTASATPTGGAALGLGLFALVIALAALTVRGVPLYGLAAAAAAAQALLMGQAGQAAGLQIAGALVLFFAALAAHTAVDRLRASADAPPRAAGPPRPLDFSRLPKDMGKQTMEAALWEAKEQNDRLWRLQREKESLVQLIVHDLRSPLNATLLSLEFIAQEIKAQRTSPDLLEAIDDARTTSSRLDQMISQILDTAKLEEGRLVPKRQPVPARELLERALKQLAPVARAKALTVTVSVPDDLVIGADPRLFPRVIENLLSNSIRHTPEGGKVLLAAAQDGAHGRLSVHNNGSTIDAESRERIFDKFQQGGESERQRLSGWGLGLYFCRMVVEAHGGHIAVEDVDDWPTSFVIRVPVGQGSGASTAERPSGRGPALPEPA